ncbi:efflux RND transporter permease subunit [Phreatobacter sp. AB_2022a]|uniref:efflux RND transporter permease subunit n=1 Tax=Phreatobacter sp. AB_2022a TaxID=3003134 RepID=UPI00056FF747|nr:CusA/CzcA family heavy metal efflux RND transporter [Phreatobacter sp. AB_2022a]MCZ0737797.1 CusA/CzcA family heavy metal efflux RND transporter [Phreatobacter sp. AB_2022a]CEJ15494.1 Cobalt-zinc-cadmium resistance protein CzcA [bacterium YEK0313]
MNAIVEFALKQRVLMVLAFGAMCLVGALTFMRLNIEAYPDPVPPMVNVITQGRGLSAEEIERYITIPIEGVTAGLQNLKLIRTTSVFGLSDIKLQFTYDVTYELALQRVLNQLSLLPPLPNGAQPQISPMSPIGEIFRYRIVGPPDYSVTDLKTLQTWVLQRRFRAIPGVVDVVGWGGKNKTYDVSIDFNKLLAYGLTLPQVMTALQNANLNVGGNTVSIGVQSGVVRGVGLISSIDDLNDTFIATVGHSAVRVRDIATVTIGNQPRLGIAGQNNDDDVVQGIVLMRRGEQSMPTILRVQEEVARLSAGGVLPPGVRIERIYDRKELIDVTTATVLHSALFGIVLIFFVQWLFLGNLRCAITVAATIPFALAFAVTIMVLRGESANLLSVGAIDFGLIVDATVIMTENIFRLLAERSHHKRTHGLVEDGPTDLRRRLQTILGASNQVVTAILFSCLIIVTSFIPLFTMQGVEGYIFGPMAKTYAYALAGGLTAAFFVTPAIAAFLLKGELSERETPVVRALRAAYEPLLERAVARRPVTLLFAGGLLAVSLLAGRSLGLEFLPKLEEGNLWIRATLHPTISLEEGNIYANRIRRIVAGFPEVASVVSQQGRTDDGTEVAGFNNVEMFTPLKPREQWRPGVDKAKLVEEILAALQKEFPGVDFNFSQYLEDNVSEAASGVKGENAIKLFGNNLAEATDYAERIRKILSGVRGIDDLAVFTVLGQPTIAVTVDRLAAGRYGLSPGDINTAIRTAVGGDTPGDFFEPSSDRRFPIIVRLAPEFRQSPEAIQNLRIGVADSDGTVTQIPLSQVATVSLVSGASTIYREQQQRYIPIRFSVRDRDLGSTISEAQARVANEIRLPPGMRIEWAGEFENLLAAIARLQVVVPMTLLLIAFLLFANFNSLTDTLLALSVIPLAMVGGVFSLFLTGTPFGVSAAIGFIALIGVSVMEGIIVITYFNGLVAQGRERVSAAIECGKVRMRPVMMTCVAACVGLTPAALSTGIGSQVQKPLAYVVVGGVLVAPFLILVILPALIVMFSRRQKVDAEAGALG